MTGPGADEARLRLLESQLARMRGMNALYHRLFFRDVRFTTILVLGAIVAARIVDDPGILLVVPFIALIGACQTAFDASYLIFSRHYAQAIERRINASVDDEVLVGHRLENDYLFPLDRPKIVTVAGGDGFSWFGFMTVLYTLLGIGAYAVGLIGGLSALDSSAVPIYLVSLLGLTAFALVVGIWWFVAGTGERRLAAILEPWSERTTVAD